MAIGTGAATAVEAIKERMAPALDTLDETMRQVRRVVIRGRHGAEDAAAAATLLVRRRPLGTITMAAGAGALVGGLVGFGLGWLTRCSK
jgi:ElaB/YqjD/DUF883 family membrane-anchored ribosome-binding protein